MGSLTMALNGPARSPGHRDRLFGAEPTSFIFRLRCMGAGSTPPLAVPWHMPSQIS